MWSIQRRLILFVHFFSLFAVLVCSVDIDSDSSLISEHAVDVDGTTATATRTSSVVPLEVNDLENDRFRFDVDYREEMHPSIRPLDHMYQANTALSAKFRSLCSIKIQIWWDDGRDGTASGHLELGQVQYPCQSYSLDED